MPGKFRMRLPLFPSRANTCSFSRDIVRDFAGLLSCELHHGIDAERRELDMAARMVLELGRQAAHLNDLPRVSAGALQYLFPELIEVEMAQLETIGACVEQLFGVPLLERWNMECVR